MMDPQLRAHDLVSFPLLSRLKTTRIIGSSASTRPSFMDVSNDSKSSR